FNQLMCTLPRCLFWNSEIQRTEHNIFLNGLFEELVFRKLEHDPDMLADQLQLFRLRFGSDTYIPDVHRPFRRLQKAIQMEEQRRFARSCMSDDCSVRSRFN